MALAKFNSSLPQAAPSPRTRRTRSPLPLNSDSRSGSPLRSNSVGSVVTRAWSGCSVCALNITVAATGSDAGKRWRIRCAAPTPFWHGINAQPEGMVGPSPSRTERKSGCLTQMNAASTSCRSMPVDSGGLSTVSGGPPVTRSTRKCRTLCMLGRSASRIDSRTAWPARTR